MRHADHGKRRERAAVDSGEVLWSVVSGLREGEDWFGLATQVREERMEGMPEWGRENVKGDRDLEYIGRLGVCFARFDS